MKARGSVSASSTGSAQSTTASVKLSQSVKEQQEETHSRTVKTPDGMEITDAVSRKLSTTVTLEVTVEVSRVESAFVSKVQTADRVKLATPPFKNVAMFAEMLSQRSTCGPFIPSSTVCESPLVLTSSMSTNTVRFLERMIHLGAVPPECYLWGGLSACRVFARDHGYGFTEFADMKQNAFMHIRNKRDDLDRAWGVAWPTIWLRVTLLSEDRILLPGYIALDIFKANSIASHTLQQATRLSEDDILDQLYAPTNVPDLAIEKETGIGKFCTVTLEDGTEKRYVTQKLKGDPELRPLLTRAMRQALELRTKHEGAAAKEKEEIRAEYYRPEVNQSRQRPLGVFRMGHIEDAQDVSESERTRLKKLKRAMKTRRIEEDADMPEWRKRRAIRNLHGDVDGGCRPGAIYNRS